MRIADAGPEGSKEEEVSRVGWWMSCCVVTTGFALMAGGCGQKGAEADRAEPTTQRISAMVPCGQVGPFSEVEKVFRQANPGVELDWIPENMVTIVSKIVDGKERPDVVLSMGDLEMDKIEKAGLLLAGTRTKYAGNSLAVTVPKGNPGKVHGIADLVKPSVKAVSIPSPDHNSVGKHAVEALRRAGIWSKIEEKVLFPQFAADSKDVVAKQQVQASIAYHPCVTEVHVKGAPPAKSKNEIMVGVVPADLYQPFWCEAAVVKGSENPVGGRKLVEFLKRPEVETIYREWNFVGAGEAEASQEKGSEG